MEALFLERGEHVMPIASYDKW